MSELVAFSRWLLENLEAVWHNTVATIQAYILATLIKLTLWLAHRWHFDISIHINP